MPSKVKASLEGINEVSLQILSLLDVQIESFDLNTRNEISTDGVIQETSLIENTSPDIEQDKITDKKLFSLLENRQSLITQLFEMYTQEQLSVELPLVNMMVDFDKQLIVKSQSNKQLLGVEMLKLQKSKKVKSLYQKY